MAQCIISNTRVVRQEREDTEERAAVIQHKAPLGSFILNTNQMRDSSCLDIFRPVLLQRDRKSVVEQGVMKWWQVNRKPKGTPVPVPTSTPAVITPSRSPHPLLQSSTNDTSHQSHPVFTVPFASHVVPPPNMPQQWYSFQP
jgi:hypothetical protein